MGYWQKVYYRTSYLKSEEWQTVRIEALVAAEAVCCICGKQDIKNDAHHIFYPDSWWDTKASHLRILCRACHTKVHELNPMMGDGESFSDAVAKFEIIRQKLRALGDIEVAKLPDRQAINFAKLRKSADEMAKKLAELGHVSQFADFPRFSISKIRKLNQLDRKRSSGDVFVGIGKCVFCRNHNMDSVVKPRNVYEKYGIACASTKTVPACEGCWRTLLKSDGWPAMTDSMPKVWKFLRTKMTKPNRSIRAHGPDRLISCNEISLDTFRALVN